MFLLRVREGFIRFFPCVKLIAMAATKPHRASTAADEDYESGEELDQQSSHEKQASSDGDVEMDDLDLEMEPEDDEEEYTPVEEKAVVVNTIKEPVVPPTRGTGKRGRPRLMEIEDLPEGFKVVADEIVTPDDPKGDSKIDEMGNLLGGRRFQMDTFKVPGKGLKKFAISTDIARCVGYRDSYFLFQRHMKVLRVTLSDELKAEMINSGVLPVQYKTRHAYLIAARSAYKEFGAKIIQNGKQVTDDYYEDAARAAGGIEGAPALFISDLTTLSPTPDLHANKKNANNISVLVNNNMVDDNEVNWMYEHAKRARQFDSMLLFDRSDLLKNKSSRDVYTGLNFVPDFTQSSKAQWKKISDNSNGQLIVETVVLGNNAIKTGLSSVPLEIFDDCVDEQTKLAILEQQRLEADSF